MSGQSLATVITARRKERRLSQQRAADLAGVHRLTWRGWENGSTPEDFNYAGIERALEWEPGSVEAVLAGGKPKPQPEPEPIEPLTPRGRLLLQLYDELIAEGNTHEEADAAVEAEIVRIRRYLRDRQQKSPARGTRARPTG